MLTFCSVKLPVCCPNGIHCHKNGSLGRWSRLFAYTKRWSNANEVILSTFWNVMLLLYPSFHLHFYPEKMNTSFIPDLGLFHLCSSFTNSFNFLEFQAPSPSFPQMDHYWCCPDHSSLLIKVLSQNIQIWNFDQAVILIVNMLSIVF